MGLSSWECVHCGLSILHNRRAKPYWSDAVAVLPDGRVFKGSYDGYGRLEGPEGTEGEFVAEHGFGEHDYGVTFQKPTMVHQRCWDECGAVEYCGESERADDQGHFIDEDRYGSEHLL